MLCKSGHINLVTCYSKSLVACYVNLVTCYSKSLVACYVNLVTFFIVPPALELIHFGKGEIWQRIDSMEAAYSQLIDWSPSAAVPTSSSSQWGDNILVVGDPKRQSGSKVKSIIADSFGFTLNGEVHNVSGYLKSHGGYELEMVGSGRIMLGNLLYSAQNMFWNLFKIRLSLLRLKATGIVCSLPSKRVSRFIIVRLRVPGMATGTCLTTPPDTSVTKW